jgi:tRNA pseudouridine55 synthase
VSNHIFIVEIAPVDDKFYLIDKPKHWTSFDVVKKIKNIGSFKKIGHAGTLDPLATGLLILCVGKYTKKIEYFQGLQKTYEGTFILGKTTPSIDLETEIDQEFPTDHIKDAHIFECANSFVGKSNQIPPIYSAVKLNGERLYKYARAGIKDIDLEIKSRDIFVYNFDIIEINMPEIKFQITCTKGTYIRSIVRDFGLKLNSGAYLSSLIRTKIGDYSVENSMSIENFQVDKHETI